MWLVALVVMLGVSLTASARPCATLQQEAVRRQSPATLKADQARPMAESFIDHDTLPLRVHLENEGVRARAELALDVLAEAWQLQVVEQGYPQPLRDEGEGGDDRIDVYIRGIGAFAGRTTRADDDTVDDVTAAYAFMEVNPALDDATFRQTLHHEFAHLIHFAVDLRASLMWFEASAVLQEALADPSSTGWAEDLDDFQAAPNAPLTVDGIQWQAETFAPSFNEYGAAFFLLYLEHTYGDGDGELVKDLWLAARQGDAVDGNEPDFVDVLRDHVDDDLRDVIVAFASWRALVSAWSVPGEGYALADDLGIDALLSTRRLTAGALGTPLTLSGAGRLYRGGCVVVEHNPADDVDLVVEATANEDGVELQVVAMQLEPGVSSSVTTSTASADVSHAVAAIGGETLVLSVCAPDMPDPDDALEPLDVVIELRRADDVDEDAGAPSPEPEPTPEPTVSPEPPPNCGCQMGRRGSGKKDGPFAKIRPYVFLGMITISLLMMIVRGRRAMRRRKTFKGSSWSADQQKNETKESPEK